MAQHMASEFVWRLKEKRIALPAFALTDIATITAIANDNDFARIFERQIEALGKENDIAFGLTTSGGSINVRVAITKAREMGLKTILLNNKNRNLVTADVAFDFISFDTAEAQEAHLRIIHDICDKVEKEFA